MAWRQLVLAGQSAGLAGRVTLHLELAELTGQWTPQLELVGLAPQPGVAGHPAGASQPAVAGHPAGASQPGVAGQPALAASQPAVAGQPAFAASRDRSLC